MEKGEKFKVISKFNLFVLIISEAECEILENLFSLGSSGKKPREWKDYIILFWFFYTGFHCVALAGPQLAM